jgi:hypothetical protein
MTTIYDDGSYRTEVSVPSFGDGGVQRLFAPMKRDPEAPGTPQGCIIFTEPDQAPDPEKAPTPIHELIYRLFPDREAEAS